MNEEINKGIKAGKAILDGRRSDNVEQQRKIAKELLKYWKESCNGKPLTTSEQVVMHDVELRGYKAEIDILKHKVKQFEIENAIILFLNLIVLILVLTKIING